MNDGHITMKFGADLQVPLRIYFTVFVDSLNCPVATLAGAGHFSSEISQHVIGGL